MSGKIKSKDMKVNWSAIHAQPYMYLFCCAVCCSIYIILYICCRAVCCRRLLAACLCKSSPSTRTHRRSSALRHDSPNVRTSYTPVLPCRAARAILHVYLMCMCRSAGAEDVGQWILSSAQLSSPAQVHPGKVGTEVKRSYVLVGCITFIKSMCSGSNAVWMCVCYECGGCVHDSISANHRLWENSKHVAKQLDKIGQTL